MGDSGSTADLQRRFGGLDRLYGTTAAARLRQAHIAVVGVGGVGSWAAEALARSGVGQLTLIDLDHIAESNINRQIHALDTTLGLAKVVALRERIAAIHPACVVHAVEEFVTPENWPGLLPAPVDGLIDACDQMRACANRAWRRGRGLGLGWTASLAANPWPHPMRRVPSKATAASIAMAMVRAWP